MSITYASNVFTVGLNTVQTGTGTITCAASTIKLGTGTFGATTVTGIGTSFTTQIVPGTLIAMGAVNLLVHSVQSATSLVAFLRSNTDNTYTLPTATAFTFYAPNTWADLLASVATQSAAIAQGNVTAINFVTASLALSGAAVLIVDDYSSMTFGNGGGYRVNNNDGFLVYRNGGSLTYTGNVQHSFFNGYLNVWNGSLTYTGYRPNIASSRVDYFSPNTKSNGISDLKICYAGGATTGNWYTHLEPLVGKFGSLSFINSTSVVATGANGGINIQFGNGVYSNVSLPSKISTLGITQALLVYLARSGGETVLRSPILRDTSLTITGDNVNTAKIYDESWPDMPSGTVGVINRDATFPGNTTVTRIFTYYPGTLFEVGNPVSLRIANALGTAAINGNVATANGVEMPWQRFSSSTNVTTNYGPFSLIARRKDLQEITSSFTPTAPITYSNPMSIDPYYTADASGLTGISANAGTKTVAISAGTTLTVDTQYDFLKWWLSQNLATSSFLAPSGKELGYTQSWGETVSGASTLGAKLSSISASGAITVANQPAVAGNWSPLSGATVALAGAANYQTLAATTAITGLPTSGSISADGALGFGTASTISATGNLSISDTDLTGTLTISTAAARTLTLTNVTGAVAINVTGGGSLTVVLSGTTASSTVTTGAGVTKAVQCSVAVTGGLTFNTVKRYGSTGAYTDLGYTNGITSDSFLVPLGQPVEVGIWTLGYLTYTRTIATTNGGFDLVADMIPEPDVDVGLDVSSYLSNIAVSSSGENFTATFNANMSVPGIEEAKAILHRLLGLESAMRALLPPGMSTIIDIEPDEIQINKPGVFLVLGAGATDVSIAGFFNTTPAKVLDSSYIINTRRAGDNLRVEIPLVKPALDIAAMAAAVRAELATELSRIDVATSTRSTLTVEQIPAGLTVAQIEASTVLAKEATVASRLAAADYTAPPAVVQANIVQVNGATVEGTGQEGAEWGPAA